MLLIVVITAIAVLSTPVCCIKCNNYTVYELRENGSIQLGEILMQQPPSQPTPGNQSDQAITCVNYTIYSGVYSLAAGINVLGDSVVIKGVGVVVLKIEHNQTNGSAGSQSEQQPGGGGGPGLQFKNNVYVEITGVEIDGSSGLLTFEDIDTLVIQSSVFRNFDQGSLDILNCLNVEMENCLFSHNGLELVSTSRKFQGGSGGLSMQYTEDFTYTQNPVFVLDNVSFVQNNALTTRNATSTFSEVASGDDFTGRGGALFILLQSLEPVTGVIKDCLFDSNTADLYGGALYLTFNKEANNNITILDTVFRNNSAFYAGGGIMFSFQVGGSDTLTNRIQMKRCTVEKNSASFGGGVYVFISISSGRTDGDLGVFSQFSNSLFTSNTATEYGAAIGVTALNIFESKRETKPSEINECSFVDNVCVQGGVVSFAYFPFLFTGRNTLQNSSGPAIMIVGAKTHVQGRLIIVNTSIDNADRGSLYITSYGQLEVKRDTQLSFINNQGNLGAAMVMSIPNSPTVYARSAYNPLCPLQYEDSWTVPDEWDGVMFLFDGNSAIVGSGVYTNYLSLCSWVNNTEPYFDDKQVYRWDTFDYRRSNTNTAYTANVSSSIFWVQTPVTRSSVLNDPIEGYPGQMLDINIRGYSEAGSLTYGVWRLEENHEHLDFNPTVLISPNDLRRPVTTTFHIDANTQSSGNNTYRLIANTLLAEESVSDSFLVRVRGCPPGQSLKNTSMIDNIQYMSCVCNEERAEIIDCGIKNVTLSGKLWSIESKHEKDRLYTYSCPPRHCQCYLKSSERNSYCYNVFVENSDDSLCTCGRSGILCGECSNNGSTGVSILLNNCVSCDDGFSTLIPLLIIADIIVFIVILVLSLPFPSWLIPAIFYIQLLPLLTENFPTAFEDVQPGMAYIASALSFYFPYDFCLYENMTAIVSNSLRFIPSVLTCIITPIVVVLRNYIYRPTTLHGVWLIVLLLYIPTLHATIRVFNCPYIPITIEGVTDYEFRWYYNGSVTCFSDPDHGGLLLLGILGLVLCIGLVPLSLIITFNKIKFSRSFMHTYEALVFHYKDLKWWSTIELVKRIPIVVLIMSFPLNPFPAFFTMTIYYFATGMIMPYQSKLANILEVALGSLITLFLLLPEVTVIKEKLDVFSAMSANITEEVDIFDKCNLNLNTSSLTGLLAPFYYLPLFVVLMVGGFQIGYEIWKHFKKISKENGTKLSKISRQFSLKHDVKLQRQKVTFTDVSLEMKEFSNSEK